MKFVLETEGVRREIKGPFNLCGSLVDLKALRDQIDQQLNKEKIFVYGWITIWPEPIHDEPNRIPLKWTEGRSIQ